MAIIITQNIMHLYAVLNVENQIICQLSFSKNCDSIFWKNKVSNCFV